MSLRGDVTDQTIADAIAEDLEWESRCGRYFEEVVPRPFAFLGRWLAEKLVSASAGRARLRVDLTVPVAANFILNDPQDSVVVEVDDGFDPAETVGAILHDHYMENGDPLGDWHGGPECNR